MIGLDLSDAGWEAINTLILSIGAAWAIWIGFQQRKLDNQNKFMISQNDELKESLEDNKRKIYETSERTKRIEKQSDGVTERLRKMSFAAGKLAEKEETEAQDKQDELDKIASDLLEKSKKS